MRVLIFSTSAWDDTNATGNTLSNFFAGKSWKNDVFYNIYMRNEMPNNNVCHNYYRLSLSDMVKNYFFSEKIGYTFTSVNTVYSNSKIIKEKFIIDLIHRFSLNFVYVFANFIYRKQKWLNTNFKEFINESTPDIFYAHMNNFAILLPIARYIKKNTKSRFVLLLTDDLYNNLNKKSILERKKLKNEYKEIIQLADKVYAITRELKKEYEKIFNIEIELLYKGCNFEYSIKNKINKPITFIYAGNLLYGRDKTLSLVAKAIEKNNINSSNKAMLEIYTSTNINKEMVKKLNIPESSEIKGKKDYDEIKKLMNRAEFNLHVESFDKKEIEYVRYSFSTKITDCLQSGSSVLAIGPRNIASMEYLSNIPGVITINTIENIDKKIETIINSDKIILNNAKQIRNFAIKRHNITKNQERLRKDFFEMKS